MKKLNIALIEPEANGGNKYNRICLVGVIAASKLYTGFSAFKRSKQGVARWCRNIIATIALAFLNTAGLHAATIYVDQPGGPFAGPCTLSAAIESANNDNSASGICEDGSGADTIVLSFNFALLSLLPKINTEVTIDGGGILRPVGLQPKFRLLEVSSSGKLTLNRVELSGGDADTEDGGAILNDGGILNVNHSVIRNSIARRGAGIATQNGGTTTVTSSEVYENAAGVVDLVGQFPLSGNGGGLSVIGASTLVVDESSVTNNSATFFSSRGGGIYNENSELDIVNSYVAENILLPDTAGTFLSLIHI